MGESDDLEAPADSITKAILEASELELEQGDGSAFRWLYAEDADRIAREAVADERRKYAALKLAAEVAARDLRLNNSRGVARRRLLDALAQLGGDPDA